MATLTSNQLAKRRQAVEKIMHPDEPIDYLKTDLNAVLQAIETWLASPALVGQMRGIAQAAAPGVFTNAQIDKIWQTWLRDSFQVET